MSEAALTPDRPGRIVGHSGPAMQGTLTMPMPRKSAAPLPARGNRPDEPLLAVTAYCLPAEDNLPIVPVVLVVRRLMHVADRRQHVSKKGNLMRWTGRLKMGYFPLPLSEAQRIRNFLSFPDQSSALDPCVGDGGAFEVVAGGSQVLRYGIELDAYRAEQAKQRVGHVIQGDTMEVHCPVESYSLVFLNPPYDWALQPFADGRSSRTEQIFLAHTYRWLKPGGVLVLVIPGDRLADCGQILASHFCEVRVYRLEGPECVRYKQVVLFGRRRDRRERERLQDTDIARARLQFASLSRDFTRLPSLPSEPDAQYKVPPGGPVQLISRGLPLDEVEDLLPQSVAYRQAARVLFAEPPANFGRPLTPLHGGHTALLAVSSMLDGIFGAGNDRHLAAWHSVKVVDKNEQEEDGVVTITERERFSNELTLIYATGEIATLK